MDNLTQRLEQVLNDPGSMNRLTELASALGLPTEQQPSTEALQQMLHSVGQPDSRQQALIHALLPYLKPGRQERLERAMQVGHMAKLAGSMLQGAGKELGNV